MKNANQIRLQYGYQCLHIIDGDKVVGTISSLHSKADESGRINGVPDYIKIEIVTGVTEIPSVSHSDAKMLFGGGWDGTSFEKVHYKTAVLTCPSTGKKFKVSLQNSTK